MPDYRAFSWNFKETALSSLVGFCEEIIPKFTLTYFMTNICLRTEMFEEILVRIQHDW